MSTQDPTFSARDRCPRGLPSATISRNIGRMVKMTGTYNGGLHCELSHGPSGSRLQTDAPKDNMGKGESFSPTDLMGAALLSCILTTMAIHAERDGVSIEGARGEVSKEMSATPRRIAALKVSITLPKAVPADYRAKIEQIGRTCPVQRSLREDLEAAIDYHYA